MTAELSPGFGFGLPFSDGIYSDLQLLPHSWQSREAEADPRHCFVLGQCSTEHFMLFFACLVLNSLEAIGKGRFMIKIIISLVMVGMFGAFVQLEAVELSDPHKGREFAQRVCAECHAVLPEDKTSPTADAPTFKAIANTRGMSRTAIIVWFQSPHQKMPHLVLEADDLDNVIAYIHSLRDDG